MFGSSDRPESKAKRSKKRKKEIRAREQRLDQLHRFALAEAGICSDEDDKHDSVDDGDAKNGNRIIDSGLACPSAAFHSHYHTSIVPTEEWCAFQRSLSLPLPVSFIVDESSAEGEATARTLMTQGYYGMTPTGAGSAVAASNGSSFSCGILKGVDKIELRKSPMYRTLNELLVREMRNGVLSRQEVVSMLPAWLSLPLRSDAPALKSLRVLELCCAPGSKTRQMLAMMRRLQSLAPPTCEFLLVSNDSDAHRCENLAQQIRDGVCSDDPMLTLTNARGDDICRTIAAEEDSNTTSGGAIEYKAPSASGEEVQDRRSNDAKYPKLLPLVAFPFLFDVVYVDVPCSGDGTFRKAPSLWRKWNASTGAALQPLQLQLLLAALDACKPGGIVVYSTCSLNPVENEQVVAHALTKTRHYVELLDAHARARQVGCFLSLRRGLAEMTGSDKKEKKEYLGGSSSDGRRFHASMLQRCVRVLPHDNDTGGFFVSLIRKLYPADSSRGSAQRHGEVKAKVGSRTNRLNEHGLSAEQCLRTLHRVGFTNAVRPREDQRHHCGNAKLQNMDRGGTFSSNLRDATTEELILIEDGETISSQWPQYHFVVAEEAHDMHLYKDRSLSRTRFLREETSPHPPTLIGRVFCVHKAVRVLLSSAMSSHIVSAGAEVGSLLIRDGCSGKINEDKSNLVFRPAPSPFLAKLFLLPAANNIVERPFKTTNFSSSRHFVCVDSKTLVKLCKNVLGCLRAQEGSLTGKFSKGSSGRRRVDEKEGRDLNDNVFERSRDSFAVGRGEQGATSHSSPLLRVLVPRTVLPSKIVESEAAVVNGWGAVVVYSFGDNNAEDSASGISRGNSTKTSSIISAMGKRRLSKAERKQQKKRRVSMITQERIDRIGNGKQTQIDVMDQRETFSIEATRPREFSKLPLPFVIVVEFQERENQMGSDAEGTVTVVARSKDHLNSIVSLASTCI